MAEIPTEYFPYSYRIQWGYEKGRQYETLVEGSFGHEQRMIVGHPDGRRTLAGSIEPLPIADRRVIRDFLNSRSGRFKSFWVIEWDWEDFLVGTYSTAIDLGVTTVGVLTYKFPFRKSDSLTDAQTMYADGVTFGATGSGFYRATMSQQLGVDYTLGTASTGETQAVLASDPGDGQVLELRGFRGRFRIPMRKMTDEERETFNVGQDLLGIWSVALIEVK